MQSYPNLEERETDCIIAPAPLKAKKRKELGILDISIPRLGDPTGLGHDTTVGISKDSDLRMRTPVEKKS
jgi:hypothetical protein